MIVRVRAFRLVALLTAAFPLDCWCLFCQCWPCRGLCSGIADHAAYPRETDVPYIPYPGRRPAAALAVGIGGCSHSVLVNTILINVQML